MKYLLVAIALLFSISAQAQTRKPLTGNIVNDIRAATSSPSSSGQADDVLAQLRAKFNADLTNDLKAALALANQKTADGSIADSTAAPCYQAMIDLNTLINSADVSPTVDAPKPGVIAKFEQVRILRNALQNQHFKDACAPLVQDIRASAIDLVSQVLSIVGGAARLGIAIP